MLTDTGQHLTIDVARWQGQIDFRRVRESSGIRHAYVRVNDIAGLDPWWHANAAAALADGWDVGAYAYNFLTTDPDVLYDQIDDWMTDVFGRPYGTLPTMADVEDNRPEAGRLSRATRVRHVDRFMARCQTHDPRLSPIYSGGWYYHGSTDRDRNRIVEPPWIGSGQWTDHPFFQAAYPFQTQQGEPLAGQEWLWESSTPAEFRAWGGRAMGRAPAPMGPWDRWTAWQFASIARIPGILGPCDVNLVDAAWMDAQTGTLHPPAGGSVDAVIAAARALLGQVEDGRNTCPLTRELDAMFGPVPLAIGGTSYRSGVDWCGSFVLSCLVRGGARVDPRGALDYGDGPLWLFFCPQDVNKWRQIGRWLPADVTPPRGAVVYHKWPGVSTYNSDHQELVVGVTGGQLVTIGGNVGPRADRVASYGPGEQYPARNPATIVGYGLPNYTSAPPIIIHPPAGDEDMAELWDLNNTLLCIRGDRAQWVPGRTPDEEAVASMLQGLYGPPAGPDHRLLKTVYLDGEVPSYTADWPHFRVEAWMFRTPPSLTVDTAGIAATTAQAVVAALGPQIVTPPSATVIAEVVVAALRQAGLPIDPGVVTTAVTAALNGARLQRAETLTFGQS